MKISSDGLELIKAFEGFRAKCYLDSAGVPTIGYGTTNGVTAEDFRRGRTVTREEAEQFLKRDVEWAEAAVNKYVTAPLNQNQFDALVSFVYNVGVGKFRESTMRRLLNDGKYMLAAEEFPKWRYAGGRVVEGLARRRRAERAWFLLSPQSGGTAA